MRVAKVMFAFVSTVGLLACTVSSTKEPSGGGATNGDGGTTNGNPPSTSQDGGTTQSDGAPTNDKPPASTKDASIDVDGTCAPFAACGGTPSGTYDYESGCIPDVFADARKQCPSLQTQDVSVTVRGSLYFFGNALTRAVTTNVSGKLVLPAACVAGQCAAAQQALAGAFQSASCTSSGAGGCTCTVAGKTTTQDATTFTIAGNTLTTADGDQYDICASATSLAYSGKSAAAEQGTFTLKKR
jgi:hypothetical protein